MKKITAEDLQYLLNHSADRFACIDVRERVEYEQKQIFHTSQLSRREIENKILNIIPDKRTKIVLYSNKEGRSTVVAKELIAAGYDDVSILRGGLTEWEADGYETVYGVHVYSKAFGEIVAEHFHEVPFIQSEELAAELAAYPQNYRIVDIRPAEEVSRTGSVPGAINIPGLEAIIKLPDLIKEGKRIIFTCAGRTRGIIATATARKLGYDVLDLENGTLGWRLTGRELQQDIRLGESPSNEAVRTIAEKVKNILDEDKISYIEATELRDRLELNNVIALDTRQRSVFEEEGHIPRTRHLAGGQAIQNEDEARYIHNEDIVFIDEEEIRSILSAWWYKRMGIRNVYVLKNGIKKWKAEGYAIEKGIVENKKLLQLDEGFLKQSGLEIVDRIDRNAEDVKIIDVRDGRKYYKSHIKHSIWIPLGRLEDRVQEKISKNSTLYIIGEDFTESQYVAYKLIEMGYRRVRIFSENLYTLALDVEVLSNSNEGQVLDDWWVTLSEYGLEEAKSYFEWEESLVSTQKYMYEFTSKGIFEQ